jgi:uncharacterized protein (TIGR03382 family)
MRSATLVTIAALALAPAAARADGMLPVCNNPGTSGDSGCNCDGDEDTADDENSCSTSGDATSVGTSLAVIAAVVYLIRRPRRRR